MATPRRATDADWDDVMDLVDRCFRYASGGMAAQWGHCYDRDRPEDHAVIDADGEIVSHIGVVPDVLLVGDHELPRWGISGVCTDPRYRGEGHMQALLDFWLAEMDTADVPISTLGGDRQRYGHVGFETGGIVRTYTITNRSFDRPEPPASFVRFDGSADHREEIRPLQDARQLRVHRDPRAMALRFGRSHMETLFVPDRAYLTFSRGDSSATVGDVAGEPATVLGLLGYAMEAYSLSRVRVTLPPGDSLHAIFARPDVSSGWGSRPHRKMRINDLPAVLAAFVDQLGERLGPTATRGELVLGIEDDDDAACLVWDGPDVSVDRTDAVPDLTLDRMAMTRLLFVDPDIVPDVTLDPALVAALPLSYFVPRLDQV